MVSTAAQGCASQPRIVVVGLQRLRRAATIDEPQRERHQRDGGHALHPPVADALAGRAATQHLASGVRRLIGANAEPNARHPSQTHSAVSTSAATTTSRAAAARLRALEAAARIPDQVTDAVAEVIDEREA